MRSPVSKTRRVWGSTRPPRQILGHSISQQVSWFAPGSAGSEAPVVHKFTIHTGIVPGGGL